MCRLLDLPQELLDHILLYIGVKDLLHLALTCKFLSVAIIPDHLNFVSVCATIDSNNTAVWQTLTTYPTLAKRISILQIIHDFQYDLVHKTASRYKSSLHYRWNEMHPKRKVEILDPEHIDPYALFKSAIRNANNVLYFSVYRNTRMSRELLHEVLLNISKHCRRLQGLFLNVNIQSITRKENPLNILSFPCLTSVTLLNVDEFAILNEIIFGTSSLVNICILSSPSRSVVCPNFFTMGNWPSLRRLSLGSFSDLYPTIVQDDDDSKVSIAISFFERHPLLECLYITGPGPSMPVLKAGTYLHRSAFPSLRSLYLFGDQPVAFTDQLYHISHIECLDVAGFELMKSLRSCSIATASLDIVMSLAVVAPNLQRLSFHRISPLSWNCRNKSHTSLDRCSCEKENLRRAISKFTSLTHLDLRLYAGHGNAGSYLDIYHDLPNLQYLQVQGYNHLIVKGPGDSRTCQPSSSSIHSKKWGDFYLHDSFEQPSP